MHRLRLSPGETIYMRYRILRRNGKVAAIWRIVWNGVENFSLFGTGFFAHKWTNWKWCPENFKQHKGMAWTISGMGGADDDSEPISKKEALV